MRVVVALLGVILLISGGVLGAAAGRLPAFQFARSLEPPTVVLQTTAEGPLAALREAPVRLRDDLGDAPAAMRDNLQQAARALGLPGPQGQVTATPQAAAEADPKCEKPPRAGVDWRGCPAKDSIALDGEEGDSLRDADLRDTGIVASSFQNLDMSGSRVEGLDLTTAFMYSVDLSGATGVPGGNSVLLVNITCPDGSVEGFFAGLMGDACNWRLAPEPTAALEATATETPVAADEEASPNSPTETPEPAASGTGIPGETAAGAPPTAVSATPSPTATAVPSACRQEVGNGDFELAEAWYLPVTSYSAAYSQEQVFEGEWALRSGITEQDGNVYSFSAARQLVRVPETESAVTLTFRLYPLSSEPEGYAIPQNVVQALHSLDSSMGDAQWVTINDERGQELESLVSMRSDAGTWQAYAFDLSHYRGETIELYFGVFNNGTSGVTALYVDGVSLTACNAPLDSGQ